MIIDNKEQEIVYEDITNELFVLNRITVERLFEMDNGAECFALYGFYYKTAKWQGTNTIWATDAYVKKSLGWGIDKIKHIKRKLKENGLIEIVQSRKDGKIDKWYIKLSYIVSTKKQENIKVKVVEEQKDKVDINNTQNLLVEKPINRKQETNALELNNICLKNKIEMLKDTHKDITNNDEKIEIGKRVIEYLDQRTGGRYKPTKSNLSHITARLDENYTEQDCMDVIDKKCVEWMGDEKMEKFLRPETLFSPTKFQNYLSQPVHQKKKEKEEMAF